MGAMNPPSYKKRNVRDLSYLVTPDGKRLKENLIYRSATLRKFKKKDFAFFRSIGLATIIDLRTPAEIKKKPDPVLEGVNYLPIPLLREETIGITHERGLKGYGTPPHMPSLYAGLVTAEESLEGLSKAIKTIIDPNRKGAILWHCTEGKDRCGVLTAIFLWALGYREEDIFADYQRSNDRSEKRGRKYRRLIKIFLRKKELANAVYRAMLASPEYLRSAFDAIKDSCGGIDAFVKDKLGIDPLDIQRFAKTYLL